MNSGRRMRVLDSQKPSNEAQYFQGARAQDGIQIETKEQDRLGVVVVTISKMRRYRRASGRRKQRTIPA